MNRAASKKPARNASRKTGQKHSTAVARRTTITMSPAAHEIVERFKNANGTSTSAAIDEIIQRSEPRPSRLRRVNGLLVLSDPPSSPDQMFQFTVEDLKDLEDEMDKESIERLLHRNDEPSKGTRKDKANR